MAERPILFSGAMVRALLSGSKTQTRRLWKMPRGCQWYAELGGESEGWVIDPGQPWWLHVGEFRCPYGQPGDRLWVRESGAMQRLRAPEDREAPWMFRHDVPATPGLGHFWIQRTRAPGASYSTECTREQFLRGETAKVVPSIHMPRWASRILLEVTDVRVERLQDISETDAAAEGVTTDPACPAYDAYAALWDQINGAGAWSANPWVWALSFKRSHEATHGITGAPDGKT